MPGCWSGAADQKAVSAGKAKVARNDACARLHRARSRHGAHGRGDVARPRQGRTGCCDQTLYGRERPAGAGRTSGRRRGGGLVRPAFPIPPALARRFRRPGGRLWHKIRMSQGRAKDAAKHARASGRSITVSRGRPAAGPTPATASSARQGPSARRPPELARDPGRKRPLSCRRTFGCPDHRCGPCPSVPDAPA